MTHSSNQELRIGDRIAGRYEILGVVGQGSMGVVYKCRHDILGRVVAIKTLRLGQVGVDDRTQRRFEREARLASRLDHPNLIGVHDFGYTANGDPYLVMDFVSGQSLYEIMKRERYLIPERAVNLFSQVCEGLYHAHQRGVIHRDLKPANILVVKNENGPETVKIVDLGVAKMVHGGNEEEAEAITMTGEVCGSPIYLSPEQCMYQELDARTDIYSLGVCLYECLTGVPPLKGATVYDTIYLHVNEMPRPFRDVSANQEIPRKLEEAVFRSLSKQPKDRYETMIQLKHDLLESLKAGSPEQGVNVLPPESLFGSRSGSQNSQKPSQERPRPAPSSPQNQASGAANAMPQMPSREALRARREQAHEEDDDDYDEANVESESESESKMHAAKAAASKSRGGRESSSKLKRNTGSAKAVEKTLGSPDPLSMRKLVLICGALCVFGLSFGLGFAYLVMQGNQSKPGNIYGNNNSADSGSKTPVEAPTFEPRAETKPGAKALASAAGAGANAASKASPAKAGTKAQAGSKPSPGAKAKAPEKSYSFSDMENMLDTGRFPEGSQSRFQSIVRMPDKGRAQSPGQPIRTVSRLKPGHHLPQARPMPTLTPHTMNGRQMPGMGMGQMGQMRQMPGMGQMGQMNQMPGMGQMGQMRQMPGMGSGMPPIGGGGNLMDKFKAFVSSQSGGGGQPQGSPISQFFPGSQQQGSGQQAPSGNMQEKQNLFLEGNKLASARQYEEACRKLEAAYRIDPSDSEVRRMYAWALNSRAIELNRSGDYAGAVDYASRAVTLEPNNQLYKNNRAGYMRNLESHKSGGF